MTRRLVGMNTRPRFTPPLLGDNFSVLGGEKTIEILPADLVVSVSANVPLRELQDRLGSHGLCLPYQEPVFELGGTVGGAVSINLPHRLESKYGSWREWVLGMTVERADGKIVKSGSRVVKSVAGYDTHRLFIGAFGTLGIIRMLHIRLYRNVDVAPMQSLRLERRIWIERTPRSTFSSRLNEIGEGIRYYDPESCTIWACPPLEEVLAITHSGWAIDSVGGHAEFLGSRRSPDFLAIKTKSVLDPLSKFAALPGADR